MKNRLTALVASALLLIAPACGSTTPAAEDDKLTVVAAFYPLQFVAERVAGERATVTSLTSPGQEAHDVDLSAKQVASLTEADLVIYQKGFQSAVDDAVQQAQPKRVIDVSTAVELMESATDDGHEHHEHSEGDGHEHATDPHIWLDPTNMAAITSAVATTLAEVDAEGSDALTANADKLKTELTTLDNDFTAGLKNCQRKEFITSHAAFGYLAHAYGLTQIGISGLSPESDPSPTRIAEVQKLAREHGVTTIFYETLTSPGHAKAIAGDLKLRTDVLDPIEGITPESKGTDYIAVQRANLAALKTANGCQ
ncbi:metal ABC transporter substrate-binding protein [Luteococcus sp. H138]|uniref:metal ABC transporter substrate-binding protein n=1 Tax=unclassified Luteococcus TaxID=2639923 RepID=UPI00313CA28B